MQKCLHNVLHGMIPSELEEDKLFLFKIFGFYCESHSTTFIIQISNKLFYLITILYKSI